MVTGKCRGLPILPRYLEKQGSTSQGDLAVPIATRCGENNGWLTKCWLDLVTAESWGRDQVSEFGGTCLDCDGLLNCVLASISNISELKWAVAKLYREAAANVLGRDGSWEAPAQNKTIRGKSQETHLSIEDQFIEGPNHRGWARWCLSEASRRHWAGRRLFLLFQEKLLPQRVPGKITEPFHAACKTN